MCLYETKISIKKEKSPHSRFIFLLSTVHLVVLRKRFFFLHSAVLPHNVSLNLLIHIFLSVCLSVLSLFLFLSLIYLVSCHCSTESSLLLAVTASQVAPLCLFICDMTSVHTHSWSICVRHTSITRLCDNRTSTHSMVTRSDAHHRSIMILLLLLLLLQQLLFDYSDGGHFLLEKMMMMIIYISGGFSGGGGGGIHGSLDVGGLFLMWWWWMVNDDGEW